MKNVWRKYRPGFDRIAYDLRIFGWRKIGKILRWWGEWTWMRWNSRLEQFGPKRNHFTTGRGPGVR